MKSGKVFLGVLAGIASGAILGILFAPAKGSKTRNKITSKGEDYAKSLTAKYNEMLESISHKYGTTKEEIESLAAKGKSKFNELKNELDKAKSTH